MLAAIHRADRSLVVATCAWAACLLYLGLAPRLPSIGSVDGSDLSSWGHAVGTMILAVLLFLVVASTGQLTRWSTAVAVVGVATLFGIAIEALQTLTGGRQPSLVDALLDAGGAVVGVAALWLARIRARDVSRVASAATAGLVTVVVVGAVFFTPPASGTTDCPTEPVEESDQPASETPRGEDDARVQRDVVALYDFRAGEGDVVADVSGVAPALDLELSGSVAWLGEQGLRLDGGAARSEVPATKITEAVQRTGELTFAAWVRSADLDQVGPARVATISEGSGTDDVNVHLGQEADALSVRLRATCGLFNWWTVPDVFTSESELMHVAVTFSDGVQRTYVDADLVLAERLEGSLGDWDPDYPLVIGNEATMDRPFHGDVLLVAVYDRALSAAEVAGNVSAGPSAPSDA